MEDQNNNMYARNTVEFVTVAVEYCSYMEHAGEKGFENLVYVMQKLLPLLYLKTALVEKTLPASNEDPASFVTEESYNNVRSAAEKILGANDAYFDGEAPASVSENLADIYQDLKDFTECYRQGRSDLTADALFYCLENFETYWGRKLIQTQLALHGILYNEEKKNDSENADLQGDD